MKKIEDAQGKNSAYTKNMRKDSSDIKNMRKELRELQRQIRIRDLKEERKGHLSRGSGASAQRASAVATKQRDLRRHRHSMATLASKRSPVRSPVRGQGATVRSAVIDGKGPRTPEDWVDLSRVHKHCRDVSRRASFRLDNKDGAAHYRAKRGQKVYGLLRCELDPNRGPRRDRASS